MSFDACAALVERADPERFRAIMASPVAARRVMFPLFAFNVEVSRAPWVTQEPMIAEMRLQWWRDVLEEIGAGAEVRKHEVVDALADVLDAEAAKSLDALVVARRWDIYKDAFEDAGHLDEYLNATSGNLIATGARLLGATDVERFQRFGYGVGVANVLRAVPELEDRGRKPLVDGTQDGVKELALRGQKALGRRLRHPVAVTGFMARRVLTRATREPAAVAYGLLETGPICTSIALAKAVRLGA